MDTSQTDSEQEGKEALMAKSWRRVFGSPEEAKERHEYKKKLREEYKRLEKEVTEEQLDELVDVGLRDIHSP